MPLTKNYLFNIYEKPSGNIEYVDSIVGYVQSIIPNGYILEAGTQTNYSVHVMYNIP